MKILQNLFASLVILFILRLGLTSCTSTPENIVPTQTLIPRPLPSIPPSPSPIPAADKWSLWTNGTQLRGANIYQRRVFTEVDGNEYMGPGPFGPPYTQDDFNHLAALGANYVNISTAGLFTINPPYTVDEEAVANLDHLLEMASAADMFAVITFRTGPGRSEFAIIGGGDWLPDKSYIVESVWTDESARKAWDEMWHFAAERYRDNPIVVGYDLMCEPNGNALLDIWDPQTFYDQYTGTGYDWNAWYPSLVSAIRETDSSTPILVGGNSYSDITWLPYITPMDDPHIVYMVHQYSPHEYTHQGSYDLTRTYPGYFDTNYDGNPENFDRAWLENLLSSADDFTAKYNVPMAVNEYGVERWVPGAADYIRDEMDIFEGRGWNYAAWQWFASWPALAEGDNDFNFRLGPDPSNLTEIENPLFSAYITAWERNIIRPSNFRP